MNFRSRRPDRPEFNLIPMIDVLIVLVVFLVLTTTFRRETGLKIRLPEATTPAASSDGAVDVAIDADGRIQVDHTAVPEGRVDELEHLLAAASRHHGNAVVIRADRRTPHQAVMTVLDVASRLGLVQISFATELASPDTGAQRPADDGR